jgi:hypothetical protein
MFGMKRQRSETQSTNQMEWMEINSIKKLMEINNKQRKERQGLEITWNKREILIRAKT